MIECKIEGKRGIDRKVNPDFETKKNGELEMTVL